MFFLVKEFLLLENILRLCCGIVFTYVCNMFKCFLLFKSLWYNHLQEEIIIRHYYCISLIFHMALNEYFGLSFREIHFCLLHPPPVYLWVSSFPQLNEWYSWAFSAVQLYFIPLIYGDRFYLHHYLPLSKASCYRTEAKLTFKYKIQFGFWPLELADSSCKIDGTSA